MQESGAQKTISEGWNTMMNLNQIVVPEFQGKIHADI